MKTDTFLTGVAATLVTLTLIMIIAAFTVHGSNEFFNMGAHHGLQTSETVNSVE